MGILAAGFEYIFEKYELESLLNQGTNVCGSPELDNLVSQAKNVNLSEYKKIENQWAKALENGQKVRVSIDIHYDQGGVRPSSFDVSYTIDDVYYCHEISN